MPRPELRSATARESGRALHGRLPRARVHGRAGKDAHRPRSAESLVALASPRLRLLGEFQDIVCFGSVDVGGARHGTLPARDLVSEFCRRPGCCPDAHRMKHAEHQAGELGVEGDDVRKLTRERQYTFREGREADALETKLSVRDLGENAMDQMGRLLVHAPARTGRAQPALTGERDNVWPTTAGAFEAYEAMAEIATGNDGAELALDEGWQTPGRVVAISGRYEGVEVIT